MRHQYIFSGHELCHFKSSEHRGEDHAVFFQTVLYPLDQLYLF